MHEQWPIPHRVVKGWTLASRAQAITRDGWCVARTRSPFNATMHPPPLPKPPRPTTNAPRPPTPPMTAGTQRSRWRPTHKRCGIWMRLGERIAGRHNIAVPSATLVNHGSRGTTAAPAQLLNETTSLAQSANQPLNSTPTTCEAMCATVNWKPLFSPADDKSKKYCARRAISSHMMCDPSCPTYSL